MDAVFPDEPGPDLFELANSVTALLDAPVTIEDLSSRVIAFSATDSHGSRGAAVRTGIAAATTQPGGVTAPVLR